MHSLAASVEARAAASIKATDPAGEGQGAVVKFRIKRHKDKIILDLYFDQFIGCRDTGVLQAFIAVGGPV